MSDAFGKFLMYLSKSQMNLVHIHDKTIYLDNFGKIGEASTAFGGNQKLASSKNLGCKYTY